MKKSILFILTFIIFISFLTGCGSSNNSSKDNSNNQSEEDNSQDSDVTENMPLEENKGWLDSKAVRNSQGMVHVFFRWPAVNGKTAHTGRGAFQGDGTLVLVDAYSVQQSPEVDSIDQVFPAYFQQTTRVFESFYEGSYSNGSLTIDKMEIKKIGEYEFYKYRGTHNYKYKGAECSKQYVIYLTETKATGAYIYWLVSDVTEDQSAGAKMEDNAYRIALSVREE